MENEIKKPMPVKERDMQDLFDLTFELCGRTCMQPMNRGMNEAYWEARNELWTRIENMSTPTELLSENTSLKERVRELTNALKRFTDYADGFKARQDEAQGYITNFESSMVLQAKAALSEGKEANNG